MFLSTTREWYVAGAWATWRMPRVAGNATDCAVEGERRGGEVGLNQKSAGDRDRDGLLGEALVPAKCEAAGQQALGAIRVGR